MRQMNIQLRDDVVKSIEQRALELHLTAEQVINKTLEDVFYLEKVQKLRERISSGPALSGPATEEETFDEIS